MQMTNPAIQNDFSYYRRTISRNRLNNQQVRPWKHDQMFSFKQHGFTLTTEE